MTMADRIVVMKDGRIQQVGTPEEVYETPANVFVGGFIGTPPMNFIHGTLTADGHFVSESGAHKVLVPSAKAAVALEQGYANKPVILGIRPEDISDDFEKIQANPNCVVDIKVELSELLGSNTNIYTNVDNDAIIASVDSRDDLHRGSPLKLVFDMEHCHLFDVETEARIK
jgi:multiple sugar transport system ATP-binding protein